MEVSGEMKGVKGIKDNGIVIEESIEGELTSRGKERVGDEGPRVDSNCLSRLSMAQIMECGRTCCCR